MQVFPVDRQQTGGKGWFLGHRRIGIRSLVGCSSAAARTALLGDAVTGVVKAREGMRMMREGRFAGAVKERCKRCWVGKVRCVVTGVLGKAVSKSKRRREMETCPSMDSQRHGFV